MEVGVQNLYKPYFLANRFDYVIGNPPWFTYSSVKNQEYQDTLNRLADKYGVRPQRKANFPHLEIAAIFLAYCSSYFLRTNGKIAFVLPRSFLTADHHDNTRSGKAKGFAITSVWDLEKVTPLFRVPSCIIFGQKVSFNKGIPAAGVQGLSLAGRLPEHNCNWNVAQSQLSESAVTWYYVRQGKSTALTTTKIKRSNKGNPYKLLFKQGATIVPRNFYFVELDQSPPDDFEDRILNIRTSDDAKIDAKKPWKDIEFKGRIESKYLFRTALSRNILPFALYKPELVTLPISITGKPGYKRINVLSATEIRKAGDLHASKWFQQAENQWVLHRTEKNKTISSEDYLNWQNKLSGQNLNLEYLVIYTASSKDANATVVKRSEIDLPFIVESKAYWYASDLEDEVHYLSAILNSNVLNLMIKDFQTRGLFGARDVHKRILDIYYPKFSAKEPRHNILAAISKRCHEMVRSHLQSATHQRLGTYQLGRLRRDIRLLLADKLKLIDKVVRALVKEGR